MNNRESLLANAGFQNQLIAALLLAFKSKSPIKLTKSSTQADLEAYEFQVTGQRQALVKNLQDKEVERAKYGSESEGSPQIL